MQMKLQSAYLLLSSFLFKDNFSVRRCCINIVVLGSNSCVDLSLSLPQLGNDVFLFACFVFAI